MTNSRAQTFTMPTNAAAMAASLLALLYVAPLAAQGTASLLDLLSNPKSDQMPALVLAPSDGVMLAGRPMIPALPRLTVTAQPGDALTRSDGQRLPGAQPQITALPALPAGRALPRVAAERLIPHYPNPETADDRALLEGILGSPLPAYLVKIEPATNAPKWEDNAAQLTQDAAAVTALPQVSGDRPWGKVDMTATLAALSRDDLNPGDGFEEVAPPPPPPLVAQTLTAVIPDVAKLSRVVPDALSSYVPNAAIPADRKLLEAVLGTPLPEPYATQAANPVDLTGKDLDLAMQAELIRAGCLKGTADGSFGSGSQGALDLFFAKANLQPVSADRSQAVLNQIIAAPGQVCDAPYAAPKVVSQPTTQPATPKVNKPAKVTIPPKVTAPPAPAKPSKKDRCKINPAECASNG